MPVLKRNHRHVLAAQALGGKQTQYRVEGAPGLWLYVSPTGVKTWYARYQVGAGSRRKDRWFKIGDAASISLDRAVESALQVRSDVQVDERDPHVERTSRRNDALTFAAVFDEWHERHAKPKLARADLDLSIYKYHLQKEFAQPGIVDIKRIEIGRLRDEIASKSGVMGSNNVIILINRVMNWAVDEGLIEYNPGARLRKAGQAKPRERVLTADEMRRFWSALAAMETMTGEHAARGARGRVLTPATRSILRLLLLTGQRRGEITASEKAEFDFSSGGATWMMPGNRTKNGLLHRVPLPPLAAAEFSRAIALSPGDNPYVFASPSVRDEFPILATTVTREMSRLMAELKIVGVSPHDLRRTVGTEMARLGIPLHVRKLVLNHSPRSRDVTNTVYNRYAYDKEKREALTAWEAHFSRIINPAMRDVAA